MSPAETPAEEASGFGGPTRPQGRKTGRQNSARGPGPYQGQGWTNAPTASNYDDQATVYAGPLSCPPILTSPLHISPWVSALPVAPEERLKSGNSTVVMGSGALSSDRATGFL